MLIKGFDAIRSINSSDNNVKFESKLTEKFTSVPLKRDDY